MEEMYEIVHQPTYMFLGINEVYKLVMDEMYEISWFIAKFEYEYSKICVVSVVRAQTLCWWWNPRWCRFLVVPVVFLFVMYDS